MGDVEIAFTVRADGELETILVTSSTSPELAEAARQWLAHCRFTAGTLRGTPVAVRYVERFRFGLPVFSLDPSMSRPEPACGQRHPSLPKRAKENGIRGLVRVQFTVSAEGRVSDVILQNKEAPAMLFEAVRDWLLACRFTPSLMSNTGKPAPFPVKMIVPYHFR